MRMNIPSPSQALELFTAYKAAPTIELRNKIVVAYMPMVECIASQMHQKLPLLVQRDDLVSWGVFGLFRAIERFDVSRGLQFHTYSKLRIRGAIIDELRCSHRPRTVLDRAKKVNLANEKLTHRFSRNPTPDELRAELGLESPDHDAKFRQYQTATNIDLSIHATAFTTGSGPVSFAAQIEDEKAESIERDPTAQANEMIGFVLKSYGVTNALTLRGYFLESRTMEEISGWFNVTESCVSQRLSRLISILKGRFAA